MKKFLSLLVAGMLSLLFASNAQASSGVVSPQTLSPLSPANSSIERTSFPKGKMLVLKKKDRKKIHRFVRRQLIKRVARKMVSKRIRTVRRRFVRRQLFRRALRCKIRRAIWHHPLRPQILKRLAKRKLTKKIRRARRFFIVRQGVKRGIKRGLTWSIRSEHRRFIARALYKHLKKGKGPR